MAIVSKLNRSFKVFIEKQQVFFVATAGVEGSVNVSPKGLDSLRIISDQRIVWLGDFNVAREEIDVHDPKRIWGHVCFCEPVQKALSEVADLGFVDIFRKLHPEPEQYTFWDYRVPNALERKIGWRLDYIMVTSNLVDKCKECWIDTTPRTWNKPSDHTYLLAEFDI